MIDDGIDGAKSLGLKMLGLSGQILLFLHAFVIMLVVNTISHVCMYSLTNSSLGISSLVLQKYISQCFDHTCCKRPNTLSYLKYGEFGSKP